MTRSTINDFDFLAALLHGRRSRLAESNRLDSLCRAPNLDALNASIFPDTKAQSSSEFQRHLVQSLALETAELLTFLSGTRAAFLEWMLARFHLENLKLFVRLIHTNTPSEEYRNHLTPIPGTFPLQPQRSPSLLDLADSLPSGPIRDGLKACLNIFGPTPTPFFIEAMLDRAYLHELLNRLRQLPHSDQETISPLFFQEVNIFNLMLALRGKLHYQLKSDLLLLIHVASAAISRERFTAMLAAQDLQSIISQLPGQVLPSPKPTGEINVSSLETLAWNRFLHLAHLTFRCDPLGMGTIVGYIGLRRIETSNLITLSEAIRLRVPPETIRSRLFHHPL